MNLLLIYGTRPEYIKILPIIKELKKQSEVKFKTLFTGQHKDIAGGDYDYKMNIGNEGSNRLDSIIQSIMNCDESIYEGIDYVLVQGDTTSAFAFSISAFHRKIKVIHLEAGLRTYDNDNPYPEEFNRQAISRLASLHLCPTELSAENLRSERVTSGIHVVGNTVLDNIINTNTSYEDTVLITMHRRENHHLIDQYFKIFSNLAKYYPELNFILPIHPNPNVRKHQDLLKGISVIEPLPHSDLIETLAKCRLVISDSGGLQEEASFLNKKIIVCRKTTERPESVGTHSFLCKNPDDLSGMFNELINNYKINQLCPYGDGESSQKIVEIFKKL